jgi:hypothetical protein
LNLNFEFLQASPTPHWLLKAKGLGLKEHSFLFQDTWLFIIRPMTFMTMGSAIDLKVSYWLTSQDCCHCYLSVIPMPSAVHTQNSHCYLDGKKGGG